MVFKTVLIAFVRLVLVSEIQCVSAHVFVCVRENEIADVHNLSPDSKRY